MMELWKTSKLADRTKRSGKVPSIRQETPPEQVDLTFLSKKPSGAFWFTTPMDQNTHRPNPKSQTIKPEWIRVNDAVRVTGISRSKIYELIKAGKIRSFSKRERGALRGIRLIFLDSLLDYIERMYAAATTTVETEVTND